MELFFDDATSVFTVELIDLANNPIKTLTLSPANITLMEAIWRNSENNVVCLEGGAGTEAIPTYWVAFTRDNAMTWNILQGATPEVAALDTAQTAEVMGWLIGGRNTP